MIGNGDIHSVITQAGNRKFPVMARISGIFQVVGAYISLLAGVRGRDGLLP